MMARKHPTCKCGIQVANYTDVFLVWENGIVVIRLPCQIIIEIWLQVANNSYYGSINC